MRKDVERSFGLPGAQLNDFLINERRRQLHGLVRQLHSQSLVDYAVAFEESPDGGVILLILREGKSTVASVGNCY